MSDTDTDAIRRRAIELGYLSAQDAERVVQQFKASAQGDTFGSFLLERQLITLDQLADLQLEDDMGATTMDGVKDPVIGQTFSGCQVDRKLGQGGMGSVYFSTRLEDGARVVVKFLAAEQAANPTWRGRFLREAEVMQRIAHPNIVAIHSVCGEGDRPHIVMELVDGHALDELLNQQESFPPLEAARIAKDIAEGLAHAHAAGVIHRDIKPANVLVGRGGEVKILDFGLAKNVESDDGLSMPGQILGTPHYMAPEQWGDHMVDARADVFSLGATLYHLVTGSMPFPGRTPQAISQKVLKGILAAPRTFAPDIPEDLELVIYRMMAVERSFRYPSAKACALELQRVLDGQPVEVPRLMEVAEPGADAKPPRRFPLLPGTTFLLGRDESCEIVIPDRSVSRQHARVERGKTGFVLHDLGSTYGTFVGGMRVRNVVLKNGDEVKLGKIGLQFRDGGLARATQTARHVAHDHLRVRTLPTPFIDALSEDGDKRAVLSLLEALAPDSVERRVERTRQRLRLLFGGELAEDVGRRMEAGLRRKRMRVPQYLFTITHENLGDDVEGWLVWWDQARVNYPAQFAPQQSQVPSRLEVTAGEPEQRAISLENLVIFPVGREEGSKVQLLSRSVSRLHATILRLHQRLVIRDEGSRFGTLLNGQRVRISFLRPGDQLTMGKVEMTFQVDEPDPSATMAQSDVQLIDPEAFFQLSDASHPSTARGLVSFVEIAAEPEWIEAEARALFKKDLEAGRRFAEKVQRIYARQATRAREALVKLLGADLGEDVAAWCDLLADRERSLPVQLLPEGWFPASTESGEYDLSKLRTS